MATKKKKAENVMVEEAANSIPQKKTQQTAAENNAAEILAAIDKDKAAIDKIIIASEKLSKKNTTQNIQKQKETIGADIPAKKITAKKPAVKKLIAEKNIAEKSLKDRSATGKKTTKKPAAAKTIEKNVAENKPAKVGAQSSEKKAIKITLNVRFHTEVGQTIFITGNHPLLGNNNAEDALPLQYVDTNNWKIDMIFTNEQLPKQKIIYNYFLKNADGSVSYDWGNDKTIDFANAEDVAIIDAWNHAGYFENAFYTQSFKNVLLRSNRSFTQNNIPEKSTHIFKVKAPLLGKDDVLCMTGNLAALGLWSDEAVLLMSKNADEDFFSAKLDLSETAFPVVYKYGIFNTATKKFAGVENREDRILFNENAAAKNVIVNDGFAVLPNNIWKGAGVAIPVFSLKSEHSFGVGDFKDLKLFTDWAKKTGLKLIQILPVNDTAATHTWLDSYPYAAVSAFALHPMYLNPEDLLSEKNKALIDEIKPEAKKLNALDKVDYEKVNELKLNFVKKVYLLQKDETFASKNYRDFFTQNEHWLVPYAAFCFLRDKNNTSDFNYWRANKTYNKEQIETLVKENIDAVSLHYFLQYHLYIQLREATAYAHENNVVIKGDIPIGIYRYSADAWQQPELFHMDEQAGAPPDSFAVKGQNWGFPTYNWSKMREDGFAWWKKRFEQMNCYFDAFRIDHILGFFRIWSIPFDQSEGIMGHFDPAIPVHLREFHEKNIWFNRARYCNPFITNDILYNFFGERNEEVKKVFLNEADGQFSFKNDFNTQRKLDDYFENLRDENQKNLKEGLLNLLSNIILFEAENTNGQYFHFRFGMEGTTSFQNLEYHTQQQLRDLYVNYYFRRQDDFWEKEAMQKLPALKRVTNMLVCGEDLGLVPSCVPEVMKDLGILSLEIQRMPKDASREFFHPNDAPYLSVVTPSTHDMSTIRAWWEEDRTKTQRFYNNELGQWGDAPYFCEDWVNKLIVLQHLYSPAMWSIFQLQDLLGIDKSIRRLMPHEERINLPSNPKNYWQYRMHLTLEELNASENYNEELKKNIEASGR